AAPAAAPVLSKRRRSIVLSRIFDKRTPFSSHLRASQLGKRNVIQFHGTAQVKSFPRDFSGFGI
ncbi:MAG: hypothetical protein EBV09_04310, partial [Actinobacteria bacterium]|nr:hypothetical protein [Actinomycetota bacterium]